MKKFIGWTAVFAFFLSVTTTTIVVLMQATAMVVLKKGFYLGLFLTNVIRIFPLENMIGYFSYALLGWLLLTCFRKWQFPEKH